MSELAAAPVALRDDPEADAAYLALTEIGAGEAVTQEVVGVPGRGFSHSTPVARSWWRR